MQCGGAHKVTSGYKRKTTLAIKRQLEELELVGDLKRRPGTAAGPTAAAAAAAEGAKQQPSAAGAGAAAGKQPVPASAAGPVAAKLGAASGSFKRPSKRVAQPAAAAANGTASQAQGQATQQQASRWADMIISLWRTCCVVARANCVADVKAQLQMCC